MPPLHTPTLPCSPCLPLPRPPQPHTCPGSRYLASLHAGGSSQAPPRSLDGGSSIDEPYPSAHAQPPHIPTHVPIPAPEAEGTAHEEQLGPLPPAALASSRRHSFGGLVQGGVSAGGARPPTAPLLKGVHPGAEGEGAPEENPEGAGQWG